MDGSYVARKIKAQFRRCYGILGVKVEDIFNTMHDRFRPEGAKIIAEFGYDIIGEGKWK